MARHIPIDIKWKSSKRLIYMKPISKNLDKLQSNRSESDAAFHFVEKLQSHTIFLWYECLASRMFHLKFIYSEKATKFCKISTLLSGLY